MSAQSLESIHQQSADTHRIWSAEEYHTLLNDPFTVLVKNPHSFAIGRLVAGEGELLMIAVIKEKQGQGLGRRCLEEFEMALSDKGADCCFLEVAKTNVRAQQLYESRGFECISTRKAYYQIDKNNREDALIMRKVFTLSSLDS